jgi:hypothetical protein
MAGRLSSKPLGGETNIASEALWSSMLYLEVLPAFILYLLALGAATLIAGHTRAGKPLFPYLWRSLLVSTAGVLAADVFLWAIVFAAGSVLTATNASAQARQIVGVLAPLGPILQPIPISLFGATAGIVFGVAWARHAGRQVS